jgi:hypothetical protein
VSEAASTHPTPPVNFPRRLGNFDQAAEEHNCHPRTLRNYAAKGFFTLYKMKGVRGVLLDLDEVELAMRRVPRKNWAGHARYGPKAVVVDIPMQPIVVNEQRRDR